jgi:hypothetical protein
MEKFQRALGAKKNSLLTAMTRGRPQKAIKRNISGLKNQKTITPPLLGSTEVGSDQENPRKRPRRLSSASSADSDMD